ncbi:aminotransferase class I/II-fold pyridoxal phosphate-dependent enzyme [Pedobacter gandavensis]|uniref:aminotransferase class I/II-fold pyridoxal phosphate-dependent enzyme n=1 Tax=Pedobacter gandavensis TaxID=2679963 RepID=UPI0024784C81|nr:aminotransferase class I/II-fold pyridoxal phosphate-dependent enzyme [Pedobacter gandavensis]WGQ09711.1 aminotransferase class I/II-fold pyridoxal phosphate-dependent enzyme [Pedobacter gandavensis]
MDYSKLSFKDFENIPDQNMMERATSFNTYLNYLDDKGHLNYRLENSSGCGPELSLNLQGGDSSRKYVNFVSNDYLGLTQHLKVKNAAAEAIYQYGTGAGASPAIGGHFSFHQQLENKIASFFRRKAAMLYTTGYTANSATIQSLLKKEDIAILDMAVHASVYEGCLNTNVKTFLHNNLQQLEDILKRVKSQYRTKLVVIDGVYSQDGDLAPLKEIVSLVHKYDAFILVDDAHGVGVLGSTGRGLIEVADLFDQIDIITGTFSKTFAGLGGYVVADPDLIRFLKFQSRQHLFSATMPPSTAMAVYSAMDVLETEPEWMAKLWKNINHYKKGLLGLGFDIGTTESAIIPVKVGDPALTAEAVKLLFDAGIYANCIIYPAVSRKDARIRMALMATHTIEQLDRALNAFEYVDKKLQISRN